MLCALFLVAATSFAKAETRVLKFYNLHTHERAEIAYKRNGRYLQSGLDKINHILRDWRENEEIKINPRLLDVIWHIYQITGSKDYINVICGYRTPETNTMLRRRSSGVAKKSQHTMGNALDFFLPDVKLSKLREVALKLQAGGVGYYPHSGSPFVHVDVGNVRHWPRMSRQQLLALFPDGETLHIPADGKPLPGYQRALAAYKARQRSGGSIMIAEDSGKRSGGLLAALFGGADEEDDATQASAAPRVVQATTTGSAAPQVRESTPQPDQPKTPATVLASLAPDAVPVPYSPPRPVDVDQKLAEKTPVPSVAVASAADTSTPAGNSPSENEKKAVALAALDVPVPTSRPDYTPALAALSADATEPPASDAIAEILAREKANMSASRQVAMLPLPTPRPQVQKASLDPNMIPRPETASIVRRAAEELDVENAIGFASPMESGRPVSDTPRLALLSDQSGRTPAAVIAGGLTTTPKVAKPKPGDSQPRPKAVVLPVKPAEAPERVFSSRSLKADATGTTAPSFDLRLVHAPDVVYTAGFRQGVPTVQGEHFTGQAVTFLAVARFATN